VINDSRESEQVLKWEYKKERGESPYALHHTPFILHPTPYTLHPSFYTLHPTPFTLHSTPYTLHPTPYTPPQVLKWEYKKEREEARTLLKRLPLSSLESGDVFKAHIII